MGHSLASKEASHARIVQVAARRFRMFGLRGVSVAEVMKEAGLTVGGFYKHFESREALVEEALAAAFIDVEHWAERTRGDLRNAICEYLSERHRDDVAGGCAAATFLNEMGRHSEKVRCIYSERLQRLIGRISSCFPAQADREARAILIFSACAGALALSRAVSDPTLSAELLSTVADELIAKYLLHRQA
jgi:TetR/AcrR family transcriptional repressor of nem operon